MKALPQIKIMPFNGDPKEWPTFISSFRDMSHNVVPSDAQRHAFLKRLLTTEVRSYIAKYLNNPSTYYDALVELKKRYGQPQEVARSRLMALMNLTLIRDDDSEALTKLNRTLHGAMHAMRTCGVLKKCLYCDNAHSIKTCLTFRDLDVTSRVEWVKEKRLCFRCLIGSHRGTECPTEIVCNFGNCNQRHHHLMHGAPRVYPVNTSATKNPVQSSVKSTDGNAMTIKNRDTTINTSLAIVPVLLQAHGLEIETFAFIDPGATVNLIREDVAKQLKCQGNAKNVFFGSFHGQDPQFQSNTVSLTVNACDRTLKADLKQVSVGNIS
ncbi:Uncharacterized protein APZ42_010503, partial [Daphnia magna]